MHEALLHINLLQ